MATARGKDTLTTIIHRVKDIVNNMLKTYNKQPKTTQFDPSIFKAEVFEDHKLTFYNEHSTSESCSIYVGDCNSIAALMMLFNFVMQVLRLVDTACKKANVDVALRIRKINATMAKYRQTNICSLSRPFDSAPVGS